MSDRYRVLGVPISITTPAQAAAEVEAWAEDDVGRFVCIRDVASLMVMAADPKLRALHEAAAMVTPDGFPIARVGQRRGLPVKRTCGPDLMESLCERSLQSGLTHYFYGGKVGVADKLADCFRARFPGIQIVGTHSPPFVPETEAETGAILDEIAQSGADVVWVGMSSPKQDVWMHDVYQRGSQTFIGVGAAFDFHSQEVARAPLWMRRNGLEWLHRFLSEPRRLWRRYLILAPKFLFLVTWEEMRRGRKLDVAERPEVES